LFFSQFLNLIRLIEIWLTEVMLTKTSFKSKILRFFFSLKYNIFGIGIMKCQKLNASIIFFFAQKVQLTFLWWVMAYCNIFLFLTFSIFSLNYSKTCKNKFGFRSKRFWLQKYIFKYFLLLLGCIEYGFRISLICWLIIINKR